jgi:hypothetical protein
MEISLKLLVNQNQTLLDRGSGKSECQVQKCHFIRINLLNWV